VKATLIEWTLHNKVPFVGGGGISCLQNEEGTCSNLS
jgi:nucleoside phosphorylase